MPPEEGTGETEEECSAEFRPLVQLDEVERVSGEEGEATLIDLCATAHCQGAWAPFPRMPAWLRRPAHACLATSHTLHACHLRCSVWLLNVCLLMLRLHVAANGEFNCNVSEGGDK